MRTRINILIVIITLAFIGVMSYSITLKYLEKKALSNQLTVIPAFRLERLNGGSFTEEDLTTGPTILNYFNSTCEFCRAQLKAVKPRIAEFKGVQLVFVSSEEKVAIGEYSAAHELQEYPNVVFLQDPSLEFSKTFGVVTIPATFIYSKDRKLIKEFKGAVKIESMLEALREKPGFNGKAG